jgi:integrase
LEDQQSFSFEALKRNLVEQPIPVDSKAILLFQDFVEAEITALHECNKSGNALVYKAAWNRLLTYVGDRKLEFTDINYNLLDGFRRQLLKDGVKTNTISNYFRTLRAIYNRGIKAKLVDRSNYPFLDITIKSERTQKRAVHINDVAKLKAVQLQSNTQPWHSRNFFLLSFSLIGISFTDLAYLKPSDIQGGRLIYQRRKTHKQYSIKLNSLATSIMDQYQGQSSKYLLPILPSSVVEDSLTAHRLIKQFIKTTNKYLKRMAQDLNIDPITTYVARHTWATTAKRMGYSNELIAEALGHEHGNKITNIYLDSFEPSVIDDVNVKVLEALQ